MHRSLVAAAATVLVVAGVAPAAPSSAQAPPTTTTVALSAAESAFGQSVSASATVAANPGPAEGDVLFVVDDVVVKANLGASGTATVVLPAAGVGQHAVSATFVPQDPRRQEGSASPAQAWVVAPVRTRLQVRVIGKGVRIPTSVRVAATGEYGSVPTGRVTLVLHRTGVRGRTRAVGRLDVAAVVTVKLGRLAAGRYRAVITYRGDPEHLRERRVERFVVRQR